MSVDNSQFYGLNKGEAQVLPSNPVIPMLRQQQAMDQQKREVQAQAVAAQIQKINFDKTRNADLPDLMSGYNDIKSTYQKSLATQDPTEKVALQNEIAQKQMMLQQHINNSQEALAHERTIGNLSLNPNAHLKDDFSDAYNKMTTTPLSNADYQKHAGYFNSPFAQADYDLNGNTTNMLKASLTPSDDGYTTGTLPGGIKQVYKNVGSDLDKQKMLDHTIQQMSGKEGKVFTRTLMKAYGGDSSDPIAAANNYVNKQYEMHKDDLTASPEAVATQWPQRVAPMTAFEQWKIAHGIGGDDKNQPTYFQDLSERMRTGVAGSGEEFAKQLSNSENYHHVPTIDTRNPKNVQITIPAKYTFDPKSFEVAQSNAKKEGKTIDPNAGRKMVKPSYTVNLDSTDPQQWTAGFAKVYKDVTGDNTAAPPKALSPYGKGKIPGGMAAIPKGAEKIKGTNLKLY